MHTAKPGPAHFEADSGLLALTRRQIVGLSIVHSVLIAKAAFDLMTKHGSVRVDHGRAGLAVLGEARRMTSDHRGGQDNANGGIPEAAG